MKKYFKKSIKFLLIIFLAYLIILVGGFFGVKNGFTNTAGTQDARSDDYQKISLEMTAVSTQMIEVDVEKRDSEKAKLLCKIDVVGRYAPVNADKIARTYLATDSAGLVNKMIFAVQMRFDQNSALNNDISQCNEESDLDLKELVGKYGGSGESNAFPWMNDEEWRAIYLATLKDKDAINRVSQETQLPPRLIVASLIVEQLRLFHSQRELFKKVFEPLKILGNATKISLGVMGVKEATAIDIENHLKDPASPYYLGKDFENKLDFSTSDPVQERFERLTREKDHYYSYLYAALYLKQMLSQWEKAGFDIKYRPEIIGTLFNVGFPQSRPKADPKVGGSAISIGEAKYSFGSLAYEFYYSGEMQEEFPYVTK